MLLSSSTPALLMWDWDCICATKRLQQHCWKLYQVVVCEFPLSQTPPGAEKIFLISISAIWKSDSWSHSFLPLQSGITPGCWILMRAQRFTPNSRINSFSNHRLPWQPIFLTLPPSPSMFNFVMHQHEWTASNPHWHFTSCLFKAAVFLHAAAAASLLKWWRLWKEVSSFTHSYQVLILLFQAGVSRDPAALLRNAVGLVESSMGHCWLRFLVFFRDRQSLRGCFLSFSCHYWEGWAQMARMLVPAATWRHTHNICVRSYY